jgi:hypothetical protein
MVWEMALMLLIVVSGLVSVGIGWVIVVAAIREHRAMKERGDA